MCTPILDINHVIGLVAYIFLPRINVCSHTVWNSLLYNESKMETVIQPANKSNKIKNTV